VHEQFLSLLFFFFFLLFLFFCFLFFLFFFCFFIFFFFFFAKTYERLLSIALSILKDDATSYIPLHLRPHSLHLDSRIPIAPSFGLA